MALNNFIKAACLSTCLGLASGSILANTVETNGGLNVYDANDSDHWFRLSGKMSLDQNLFHVAAGQVDSTLELRNAQTTVQGGVGQNLSYSFRLKRGGDNSLSMDNATVTYSGLNSWSKVSVGQVSMNYGLNTSFTEDSVSTQVFKPTASNDALGVSVTAWNDKIGFSCSVHQPSDAHVTNVGSLDTAARVSFAPLMRDNLVLHVGVNAYYQQNSDNSVSHQLAHSANHSSNVLSTIGTHKRGFGVDAAVLRGPLFLQAEAHQVSFLGSDDVSSAFGYSVEGSYALTGESRSYNKTSGSFSNLTTERDSGSWQVSARHSAVHQDATDTYRTVGASVAWTVNNNVTVLANYDNAIAQKLGAFSLRLQAAW
jgi:phosphate-selective porin